MTPASNPDPERSLSTSAKADPDSKTMGDEIVIHASNAASMNQQIDPVIEKHVLHKLDRRLAPMFATLYFLAYLDRSNIGNAGVAGMREELNLSGAQFSTAVSVFFATYVTFELPVVLAMKKLRPHRAISFMACAWAIVTIGTAFVKSFGSLIVVRLLLGACEAGFFPCLSLYITMVYKRGEQVS